MKLNPPISRGQRNIADTLMRFSPAQAVFARRHVDAPVILAYHGIDDAEQFARHVDLLVNEKRPVSEREMIDAIAERRSLPHRAALITFDDGDWSVYEHALPILRERGIPAVVFVIAGLTGTDRPFWWREVGELLDRGARTPGIASDPTEAVRQLKGMRNERRTEILIALRRSVDFVVTQRQLGRLELLELESAGVAVGNHTFSHPCLDRCSDDAVTEEIVRAHDSLLDIGIAPSTFAYPNGNVDPRAARVLNELGYEAAFLFDHRIGKLPAADRFRISRIRVDSTTSVNRLRIMLSGLHPALHHALGRH
jgi:peptidoglycan/xylan/chitin deacetylase (PgdA/CDA1 family)